MVENDKFAYKTTFGSTPILLLLLLYYNTARMGKKYFYQLGEESCI